MHHSLKAECHSLRFKESFDRMSISDGDASQPYGFNST